MDIDALLNLKDSYPALSQNIIQVFIPAVIIAIIGVIIARTLSKRVRRSRIGGQHVDETMRPVLASFIFYLIMATTIYAVLIKLGIPPTSLLAVFGAAGLAIALALKDTLSNIAAGMMLLFLRPLSVGDAVDINGTVGIVKEIGLFTTSLQTPDGLFLYYPNGIIWNNRIQNFSRHSARRASVTVRIGYEHDLEAACEMLLASLNATPDILTEPDSASVFVSSFENTAIHITCRCWLPGDNWSKRLSELHINIKKTTDKAGINMSIPVTVMKSEKA